MNTVAFMNAFDRPPRWELMAGVGIDERNVLGESPVMQALLFTLQRAAPVRQ